jgi:ABC-type molybdate transport system substrate-binding protein
VYPVAAVAGTQATSNDSAKDFIEYLASPEANAIFTKYGFSPAGH